MRIDHRIADDINLAFPRRLNGVGALLALFQRGVFCGFFARLPADDSGDAIQIEGDGLVIRRRCILAREEADGSGR